MRGGPEDAPALRTPEKHLLRGKDIGRDQRLDRVLGFWLQDAIAFQAAREKSIAGPQAAFANDLAELLAIIIAVDENKLRRLFLLESAVAGKNQPVLGAGRMDQAVSGQVPAIDDVLPDDAQPLGQPAEHAVGGEFYPVGSRSGHFDYDCV